MRPNPNIANKLWWTFAGLALAGGSLVVAEVVPKGERPTLAHRVTLEQTHHPSFDLAECTTESPEAWRPAGDDFDSFRPDLHAGPSAQLVSGVGTCEGMTSEEREAFGATNYALIVRIRGVGTRCVVTALNLNSATETPVEAVCVAK